MKISFWDVLTGILMFAGFGVVLVFANIFIDPYTILNPFPPPTLQPTVKIPTMTPTLRSLPEIWTATPTGNFQTTTLLPSLTPVASKTGFTLAPTNTFTPAPTQAITATRTNTPLGGKTSTPTRTRTPTRTSTSSSFAVTSVRNIEASPSLYTGICPKNFTLSATIYYTNDGTITYYWIRSSDSEHLGSGSLDLDGTSPDYLSSTVPLGVGTGAQTSTYYLYIDHPNHQRFDGVEIPITCTSLITSNGGGASASISVAENNTAVTTVTTNPTGSTFSITSGADAARFSINSATGVLTFINAPDYENPIDDGTNNTYIVNVHAVNGSITDDQLITVTVTDVNEAAPVFTSSNTASVEENISTSTTVLDVNATDTDTANTITYSLSGGDDIGDFNINSSSGVLTFAAIPNYEIPADSAPADNIYEIIVQASDGLPAHNVTQSITITVTDVNDAPVLSGGAASTSLDENAPGGTLNLDFNASDEDLPAQDLTFTIDVGGDSALFNIDSSTGVLTNVGEFDYENPTGGDNTYNITVRVTDNGSPAASDTQAVEITINNLDEAPIITKSFSPATIASGGVSTLTINIANTSGNAVDLTNVGFTDAFPADMQVAGTPNESITNCGSPTFSPSATDTSLSFSDGSIAVGATCIVTVDITATATGTNTTSVVDSTEADDGAAADDTLTVS